MIKLDYKSAAPLHEQISRGLRELIICGALAAEEKLPSVRDLAVALTVNPNTVQHAYRELESEGLIYSVKGRGSFVSAHRSVDEAAVEKLYETLMQTARALAFYGEGKENALRVIDKAFEEGEKKK